MHNWFFAVCEWGVIYIIIVINLDHYICYDSSFHFLFSLPLYSSHHCTFLILLKKINKWIRAAWWSIWESAWSFTCYKWMVDVSLFCFLSISFIKVTEWTCNPCTTLLKTNVHNKVIKSVFFLEENLICLNLLSTS